MNHIESLIQKHCPNGVEFRALQEICNLRAGDRIIKSMMNYNEKYPVMGGGVIPTGYYKDYNFFKGVTIARAGSAGFVSWQENPFWATDVCFVATLPQYCHTERSEVSKKKRVALQNHLDSSVASLPQNDKIVNLKFLYYFLKTSQSDLQKHLYGASMPKLDKQYLYNLQIPIPPLEIQKEIVKILDSFTELEKELEKELEARRKQYEYYREKLFSFESLVARAGGGQFVKMMRLGEVCKYIRGVTYNKNAEIHKNDLLESWKVLRANNISLNNSLNLDDVKHIDKNVKIRDNQKLKEKDILICAGSGSKEHIGKVAFINKNMDYTFGGFMGVIRSNNDSLNNKFLYFILTSYIFNDYLQKELNTSTINNLSSSIMNNFQIPIPPLKVQNEVVEILDRFDAPVNDVTSGIPAEINARKKQYEYYRERLLSFKEAE